MKLMDEVAGIVAARHCKTNIVTASVDAINFHDKIRKGNGLCGQREAGRPLALWLPRPACWWSAPRAPAPRVCPCPQRNRKPVLRFVLVDASVRLGLVGWAFQTCNTHSSDVSGAFMLLGNATNPS